MARGSGFEVGGKVGAYRLLARLGEGGVGEVFLAQREGDSTLAVLKRLRRVLDGNDVAEKRLRREAEVGATILHPNVVRTLDAGRWGDAFYVATAYLPGHDLEDLSHTLARRRSSFPSPLAVRIVIEVLKGLEALHEARGPGGEAWRPVHRDLSPRNIMVGYDGQVAVIDLGLVHAPVGSHRTEPGALLGTYRYMAPEQAVGEPPTPRVDLFAIGSILWELLTGRWLFDVGDKEAIRRAVAEARIPPPSVYNPGLPPALDGVLAQANAHAPSERFATARAMREALERAAPEWADCSLAQVGRLVSDTFPHKAQEARERVMLAQHRSAEGATSKDQFRRTATMARPRVGTGTEVVERNRAGRGSSSRAQSGLQFDERDRAVLEPEYELLRLLGEGGMGRIYLARRTGGNELGVVKIMHQGLDAKNDPRLVDRFLREARLQARCKHPNIPRVRTPAEPGPSPYFEMEFVAGLDLAKLADPNTGRVPPDLLLPLALELLDALHHAHCLTDERGRALGLVHRDISPNNLMVDFDGRGKLIDFGVALARAEPALTRVQEFVGKLYYCSPEQAIGAPVDARSDQYSFGLTLFELLTGTPWAPEANEAAELAQAKWHRDLPGLRELCPEFPKSLADVVQTACSREPKDRFSSTAAMRDALAAAMGEMGPMLGRSEIAARVEELAPPETRQNAALPDWVCEEESMLAEPVGVAANDVGDQGPSALLRRLAGLGLVLAGMGLGVGATLWWTQTRVPTTPLGAPTLAVADASVRQSDAELRRTAEVRTPSVRVAEATVVPDASPPPRRAKPKRREPTRPLIEPDEAPAEPPLAKIRCRLDDRLAVEQALTAVSAELGPEVGAAARGCARLLAARAHRDWEKACRVCEALIRRAR